MADNAEIKDVLIAFVEDADSQKILADMSWDSYGLNATVNKGGVKDAILFLSKNRSPKILIIDISSSELPLSDMHKLAEVVEPGIEVVVIGTRNEVGLFRQLLTMGVRDYIAKPLNQNLMVQSMEAIRPNTEVSVEETRAFGPGQNIGFIGAHGGAGVSTMAANTAWEMSTFHNKKTALVDLDLYYAGASQFFDISLKTGFRDMLESEERIDELSLDRAFVQENSLLSLLGGDESLTKPSLLSDGALLKINRNLNNRFQYVIYDIPRQDYVFNSEVFLKQFNVLILIATPTILSMRDTARVLTALKNTLTPRQKLLLVLNKVGSYKQGEIDVATFEKSIQRPIDCIVPFDAENPLESLNHGKPLAAMSSLIKDHLDGLTHLILGKKHEKVPSVTIKNKILKSLFSFKGI